MPSNPRHASSTSFPPGTKVGLYPPGANRPSANTTPEHVATVHKDGTVAFDVKGQGSGHIGELAWIAGQVDERWIAVRAPIKKGEKSEAVNVAETLARTAAPNEPEEELVHGARSTTSHRRAGSKRESTPVPVSAAMTGGEMLAVSARTHGVTIPDGSSADPWAHQAEVPAQDTKADD